MLGHAAGHFVWASLTSLNRLRIFLDRGGKEVIDRIASRVVDLRRVSARPADDVQRHRLRRLDQQTVVSRPEQHCKVTLDLDLREGHLIIAGPGVDMDAGPNHPSRPRQSVVACSEKRLKNSGDIEVCDLNRIVSRTRIDRDASINVGLDDGDFVIAIAGRDGQ